MKKNMRKILAVCLMFAMVLTAVNVPAATAKKVVVGKSIKLNKKKATIEVGKKLTLKATVKPKKATVTWASSKKKVATVNAKGKVVAKKAGKTNITATITLANGKTKKATCKVTVTEAAKEDAGTSTEGAITTDPGSTTTATPTPAPSVAPPAEDAKATDATLPLEQRNYFTATMKAADEAGTELLNATADVNGSTDTFQITGTAKAGKINSFVVNTGIPVSSLVYKLSDVVLLVNGKQQKATIEASESLPSGAREYSIKDYAEFKEGDSVTVQYKIAKQTADESAKTLAKSLTRIPFRAGDGNNTMKVTFTVTGVPATMANPQVGISYCLVNSIPVTKEDGSTTYASEASFITANTKSKLETKSVTDSNPDTSKIVSVEEGGTYTFELTGLHDAVSIESLELKSNVPKSNEAFTITVTEILVNGNALVISNVPRKDETHPYGYMCDTDFQAYGETTLNACMRNIWAGHTKAEGNTASNANEFEWEGTVTNADGNSFDNISRSALYQES